MRLVWFCFNCFCIQSIIGMTETKSRSTNTQKASLINYYVPLKDVLAFNMSQFNLNMIYNILGLEPYRIYTIAEIESMYDQYIAACMFIFDRAIRQIYVLEQKDPDINSEYVILFHHTTAANTFISFHQNTHMQTIGNNQPSLSINYKSLRKDMDTLRKKYIKYCNLHWLAFIQQYREEYIKKTFDHTHDRRVLSKTIEESNTLNTQSLQGMNMLLSVIVGKKKKTTNTNMTWYDKILHIFI